MSAPVLTAQSKSRLAQIRERISSIAFRPGVHTATYLRAAGFRYTGIGDTACCDECKLTVSNWTPDMDPFAIHSQRTPTCPAVLLLQSPLPLSPVAFRDQLTSIKPSNAASEQQPVEAVDSHLSSDKLIEHNTVKCARRRTFLRWPHNNNLSPGYMSDAGYFCCNINDRTICIYCNLICHNWTPNSDDPGEVHKTLSPNCPYVRSMLINHGPIPTINGNGNLVQPAPNSSSNSIRMINISHGVRPVQGQNNADPSEINDTIQAGFIDLNMKNKFKCPGCGELLHDDGSDNDPRNEHARQNPNCPYILQSLVIGSIRRSACQNIHPTEPIAPLSQRIQNCMDQSMSQRLLRQNIPENIIRQCWVDQLNLTGQEFNSIIDLYIACFIKQKQNRHINNNEDKIIVPSVRMNEYRMNARNAYRQRMEQLSVTQQNNALALDLCAVCCTEERQLACIPCGHVATCVPCGHSVRTCPMCRKSIQGWIRVYS